MSRDHNGRLSLGVDETDPLLQDAAVASTFPHVQQTNQPESELFDTTPQNRSRWTVKTTIVAFILVVGTAASQLLGQHVSNDVPDYFFAIAVFMPVAGLVAYPLIVLTCWVFGWIRPGITCWSRLLSTLLAVMPVALCFAINNLLVYFGQSGSGAGKPDVSTVLVLLLQKLVVPVSLGMEAAYDRRCPRFGELLGVLLVLGGAALTAVAYNSQHDNSQHVESMEIEHNAYVGDHHSHDSHSSLHSLKIVCLAASTVPLAAGFLLLRRARRLEQCSQVTDFELWAAICLPDSMFSLALSYAAQAIQGKVSAADMNRELGKALECIAFAQHTDTSLPCNDASLFTWVSLVPGFAYNLAIPVIISLHDASTVVPLLRAVALPLAGLVAMTGVDPVIATPFSWEGVVGVLVAFLGLVLCYVPTATWRRLCCARRAATASGN